MQAQLAECGLDRGQVDFAVALRSMRVAAPKQRTLDEHRQIDRRSLDHFAHIHVAAEWTGRNRAVTPGFRPGDADDAGKRTQRHGDAWRELGGCAFQVEIKITHLADGKAVGKLAEAEFARKIPVRAITPRHDAFDVDFQCVARLRFFDENRAGDGMRPAAGMSQPHFRQGFDGHPRQNLVGSRHHGFHRHAIAGAQFQHWRLGVVEPTPLRGFWRCGKDMDVAELGADWHIHVGPRFIFSTRHLRQPRCTRDGTGLHQEPPVRIGLLHRRDPAGAHRNSQVARQQKIRLDGVFHTSRRFLCAARRRRAQCRCNGRHP